MTRAEPRLAWIAPSAPADAPRLVLSHADGWMPALASALSVALHGALVVAASLLLGGRTLTPPPVLEVAIVAAAAPAEPLPSSAPQPAVAAPPAPVESASAKPSEKPDEKPGEAPPERAVEPPAPVAEKTPEPTPEPNPEPVPEAPPAAAAPTIAEAPPAPVPPPAPPPAPRPKPAAAKPPAKSEPAPKPAETAARPAVKPAPETQLAVNPSLRSHGVDGSAAAARPTEMGAHANFRVVSSPPAKYPRIAMQLGEEGTVYLTVEVGIDGVPQAVSIYQSSGYGSLDQAAVQMMEQWRFAPPVENGRSKSITINVPVVFKLKH